jgi:hypothetical protein
MGSNPAVFNHMTLRAIFHVLSASEGFDYLQLNSQQMLEEPGLSYEAFCDIGVVDLCMMGDDAVILGVFLDCISGVLANGEKRQGG